MYIIQHIHWLAILAAAVAYFSLGANWYSKVLFAKKWLALTKIDASDPNASKGMVGIRSIKYDYYGYLHRACCGRDSSSAVRICAWRKIGCFNRYLLCISLQSAIVTLTRKNRLTCILLMVATH